MEIKIEDKPSILLDLDLKFQNFRSALLQDPRPMVVSQRKEELVSTIDRVLQNWIQPFNNVTPSSILSPNTPSINFHHHHHHHSTPNSYLSYQPDSPIIQLRKPDFPLKLERKRSREHPHRNAHNTKAARSDGPLNTSAGTLSRRASHAGASIPLVSTPGPLTELNINGLISPTSNSDPSPPLTTPNIFPLQHHSSSPSANNLSHAFGNINHNSHHSQFHPIPQLHPSRSLSQNLTIESPNTLHSQPTSYSTLNNTPLISPHDLSNNSNQSENPLLAIINNQLGRHPDPNLSQNQHNERFLDSGGEPQLGIEKPNSLHVQLTDALSESTYQQPQSQTIMSPTTSTFDSTLNSLGAPPITSSGLVESQNHKSGFPFSEQIGDAPSSCPVGVESNELSTSSHVLSPSRRASAGTRVPLLTLPTPLYSQSTSTLQQSSNHEILPDVITPDDPLAQSTTSPPADPSFTVGLEQVYRSCQEELKPKIVNSAVTIESIQQPSSRTLFATPQEASRSPKNEGGGDSNHISTQSFQSTGPPQLHPPCLTTSSHLLSLPESSLSAVSVSSSTYPQQSSCHQDILPPPRVPSPPVNKQMGAASAGVSDELAAQFEPIFTNWLGRLCSDLDMKDSKGEPIHQTLMARKMQRLEESADFRPFKFRIQAFTNSFFEELVRHGFKEKDLPMKKVRQYLWSQSCISRFNEEGKKAKSKGNHVWHIEAQKILNGQWNFLHFQSRIIANPPTEAYVGVKWTWSAKVWDPQCSAQNIKAVFSSPELPPWLGWKGNVLSGIPGPDVMGMEYEIYVIATTNPHPKSSCLDLTFKLSVKSREETTHNKSKESQLTVYRPDSNIPISLSEQASYDNTPNLSPTILTGLPNRTSHRESMTNGTPGLDANASAPCPQLPGLSRTDSSESVAPSSPTLEGLHRQSTDRLFTRNHLMGNFEAALKQNDTEFDSTSAASVLNGMSTATVESVVKALGQFSDIQPSVDGESRSIELSNHSLGGVHMVTPVGLRSTFERGLIGAENQSNGLSDLSMMVSSNPSLGTNLVDEHVSSIMTHSSNVVGNMGSGSSDAAGMLNQIMGSSNLIPSTPSSINHPAGLIMEMAHPGHTDLNSDLMTIPNCIRSSTSCADLSTTTSGAILNDTALQIEKEAAVVAQQQAVALHEARLQTVRENLMSSDVEISDSAGNLMREAIVSDNPIARQFAADVLAPLTCSNSTPISTSPTTDTTATINTTPPLPNDTPPSSFANTTNRTRKSSLSSANT